MPSGEWSEITAAALIGAVAHIRERFEEIEFKFDFLTQQKCYKELPPVAPTTTPSAVFKDYMAVYEDGLKESISRQYVNFLDIGLAHINVPNQHPIRWPHLHLQLLIDDNPERDILEPQATCEH